MFVWQKDQTKAGFDISLAAREREREQYFRARFVPDCVVVVGATLSVPKSSEVNFDRYEFESVKDDVPV